MTRINSRVEKIIDVAANPGQSTDISEPSSLEEAQTAQPIPNHISSFNQLEQILNRQSLIEETTQSPHSTEQQKEKDIFEIQCNDALKQGWSNKFIPELESFLSLNTVGNASDRTLLEKYKTLLKTLNISALAPEYQKAIADAHLYSSIDTRMEGYKDLFSKEELKTKEEMLLKGGFQGYRLYSVMHILECKAPFQSGFIYSQNEMDKMLKNLAPTSQVQNNQKTWIERLKILALTPIMNINLLRLINSVGDVSRVYADGKWRTVVTGHISCDPRDPSARGGAIEGRYNLWFQIFSAMQKKYALEGKTLKVITKEMMESIGSDTPAINTSFFIGKPYMLDHHRIQAALELGLAIEVHESSSETYN